jgi:hypothetical protein
MGDRIFPNVTTKSSLLVVLMFIVESKTLMTLPRYSVAAAKDVCLEHRYPNQWQTSK